MAEYPDLIQLPGGPWIARAARPCGCCGATRFDVMRVRRRVPSAEKGKPDELVDSVEARCPRCKLLTDEKAVGKVLLGTFDTTTGTLTIFPKSGADPR